MTLREDEGEVGDLSVAIVSSAGLHPKGLELVVLLVVSLVFLRCFRRLRLSSLWSFKRIDRRAGAISSPDAGMLGFDRVGLPSELGAFDLLRSNASDSEVVEDIDSRDAELLSFGMASPLRRVNVFSGSILIPPSAAESPTAEAVDVLLFRTAKQRLIFFTGMNGE